MPEEYADDLTTLDGIISALYDSISGHADQKRDLRRFRSLFVPGARLIPTRINSEGRASPEVLDVDEFFKIASENFKVAGFFEKEVARRTETFGHVTHAFSTYEARRSDADAEPFIRGINSIQLFHDGTRFHVVTVFWDFERPDNPIPQEYLG
ncbi:MAG TPA: hypothetical protein VM934_03275 [Pyrinomonadaceae bacterium]|jgi:hypothetical protein|nr:hypothetical protein [Pyrinomonadaceae bacterium]